MLPSKTIRGRLGLAVRLSVGSLGVLDAHLDTLWQSRIRVSKLWTSRCSRRGK